MANGQLVSPNLDDRQWQDIVDEARSLIPRYNVEYTDHNPSDLGMTLMELFAWIVEGMIYRLNRVPDKNFIEFLNLLGITRDPASPATTNLVFQMSPIAPSLVLPKGNVSATPQTSQDDPILFETDETVTLLPVNVAESVYFHKIAGNGKYERTTGQLTAAPLSGFSVTMAAAEVSVICLGFDLATTQPIQLDLQFTNTLTPGACTVLPTYSQGIVIAGAWPAIPGAKDGTANFTQNGLMSLTVPLDWAAQNPTSWPATTPTTLADTVNRPLFWIGLRLSNISAAPLTVAINYILFNNAHATNAISITSSEQLGTSDGTPFQFFDLKNAPLYKRPGAVDPYDHLLIQVRQPLVGGSFGPWTTWMRVDDLAQGAGNNYRLDPVMGRINFGNFDPVVSPDGHGSVPPAESEIQAASYRYVIGGTGGNVGPGSITVLRTPVAGQIGVTNPGAAANGSDEESIEDTKRRGPEALRNRFRAVTAEDYEYLAQEASTDVRKVRCLQPRLFTIYDQAFNGAVQPGDPWTYGALNRDSGNVHVIIIPGSTLANRTPSPTSELLGEVADYLEQRRALTAALNVTGPRYLPIQVTVTVNVWKKAVDTGLVPDPAISTAVRDDIAAKITQFLHPTLGSTDGSGWEVGQDQTIAPLFQFIQPAKEVGFIAALSIQALAPLYTPPVRLYPNGPGVWIKFADYEMVCSAATHNVTVNKI
jgi:predicted phage baseplate assembly protein